MSNCSKKWFQNFAPKFLSVSLTESFFHCCDVYKCIEGSILFGSTVNQNMKFVLFHSD